MVCNYFNGLFVLVEGSLYEEEGIVECGCVWSGLYTYMWEIFV